MNNLVAGLLNILNMFLTERELLHFTPSNSPVYCSSEPSHLPTLELLAPFSLIVADTNMYVCEYTCTDINIDIDKYNLMSLSLCGVYVISRLSTLHFTTHKAIHLWSR